LVLVRPKISHLVIGDGVELGLRDSLDVTWISAKNATVFLSGGPQRIPNLRVTGMFTLGAGHLTVGKLELDADAGGATLIAAESSELTIWLPTYFITSGPLPHGVLGGDEAVDLPPVDLALLGTIVLGSVPRGSTLIVGGTLTLTRLLPDCTYLGPGVVRR
jgi:hypothetical protein